MERSRHSSTFVAHPIIGPSPLTTRQRRPSPRLHSAAIEEQPETVTAEPHTPQPKKRRLLIGGAKAVGGKGGLESYTHMMEQLRPLTQEEWAGRMEGMSSSVPHMGSVEGEGGFTVLAIETSCDDTAVAILRSDGTILGESIASQDALGERFGGVNPAAAKDAHEANINATISQALARAAMADVGAVDVVAVTTGPGLELCLRVGVQVAQRLCLEHRKPFVSVHHLEGHCLSARLAQRQAFWASQTWTTEAFRPPDAAIEPLDELGFPFLSLLVSGGHTQLTLVEGVGRYVVLGGTLDDALGEAYDKAARYLGLPVGGGGGPALEAAARDGDPSAIELPTPLQKKPNLDFSYAGLKNAFRLAVEDRRRSLGLADSDELPRQDVADLAASFQSVALGHIEDRLHRAMVLCEQQWGVTSLAVVGGVAANQELKRRLVNLCASRGDPSVRESEFRREAKRRQNRERKRRRRERREGQADEGLEGADNEGGLVPNFVFDPSVHQAWKLFVPPPRLCRDNGVMIAWAALEKIYSGYLDDASDVTLRPRWPLGDMWVQQEDS
ncbi:unnamed protein product [Vitrella brassicaformis CCMP3155]|uniref:N(6)-L-threonylcarbamoyladenine synthase n=1 Tax=Vitrella brassicaformis (strain CCMP3155) TaxID=1169540 RepID=A0A0G4EEI8_VITBC|nr:unnamed protein product [Vitrella brassicaformis CCMP3155]|eukprot:CEL94096.1 unnamed protein product [Vitrella brassicaformis CCMP3155]